MNFCRISLNPVDPVKNKYPHYRDADFRKLFGSTRVVPQLDFRRSEFRARAIEAQERMSISGVQEKISVCIEHDRLHPVAESGTYILKPSPPDFAYAAENEHLGMCISRELGIRTAQCGLISFADDDGSPGPLAYLTKRFDRLDDGRKLHQEDLLQVLGQSARGNAKYETSYETAGRALHDATGGRLAEVMEYFRRIVHAYLIGNDDMHMKNISLQRLTQGSQLQYDRLAPHYDALSSTLYTGAGGSFFACDLFEDSEGTAFVKYGYYTGLDFIDFGTRLGLREPATQKFLQSVTDRQTDLIDLIERSCLPPEMKAQVRELMKDRLRALNIVFHWKT
jgi:serine/threonine-protein kinase HipA